MEQLLRELYPIPRSLTGDGVRRTLDRIGELIPLSVKEVPSGTPAFDWTVPPEWNVREAWIRDPSGRVVADFHEHNLHLVGYSVPFRGILPLGELRPHLHSLPDRPDWIPYRTSYYYRTWGFCLPHRTLESLPEGDYEVVVDTTLEPGQLTYGECVIKGSSSREILVSAHVCHPSLCNDNLSGVVVAAFLADAVARRNLRHTVRVLLAPGTIGAVTWLARNRDNVVPRIDHGLVLTCLGDEGPFTYKRSRRENAAVDRAAARVLAKRQDPPRTRPFTPWGYDERQYCSPGFDLPVGCLMRTPHGEFPEYHTSADDLDLVGARELEESLDVLLEILEALDEGPRFRNLAPYGEPQLGRRGLYPDTSTEEGEEERDALLWVLNLSDGEHGLPDIAERSSLPLSRVRDAAHRLAEEGLLEEL